MNRQPKNLEYRAVYDPDMDRMVRALRVLLEYHPGRADEDAGSKVSQVPEVQPSVGAASTK